VRGGEIRGHNEGRCFERLRPLRKQKLFLQLPESKVCAGLFCAARIAGAWHAALFLKAGKYFGSRVATQGPVAAGPSIGQPQRPQSLVKQKK